jgi:iron complex outermembrane recepter protein
MQAPSPRAGTDYHRGCVPGIGWTPDMPGTAERSRQTGIAHGPANEFQLLWRGSMQPLKRNLLSVALASATLMLANGAHAQSADQNQAQAEDIDEIKVVGIRRSIEESTDTKRESTSIVEAISAEDIGKLPDTSIADSLARLPGLTAQRFGGRPQEINIRGFAGDFSTTTLNGREQVSLGNNRGVEFDQYPSELVSQVLVYKTVDAQLVGQGLSGTVDLKTVRPLAFGKRAFAANVRGDMNKVGDEKENGYRYSFSYIDQFADNTVGIALGYAHLNNPGQAKQFGDAWGYDGGGLFGGGKLYDLADDNERDGLMGVLEFRPNENYHTVLDIFYSQFDREQQKRGMEFAGAFGGTIVPGSTPTNASFTGINPVIRNDFNATYDDLFAIGWKHELSLGEYWTATADIGYSDAKRKERILETYAGIDPALARDTLNVVFDPEGFFRHDFGYDYGDANILRLGDAGGWGQDGYIKDFEVNDSLTSFRLDFERRFDDGWFSSIEFGANLTDRTKSRGSNEAFLDLTGCLAGVSPSCPDGISQPIPTDLRTSSAFNAYGVGSIFGYDAMRAYQTLYTRRGNVNGDISNKNWEVNEQVTTAYVQANINTEIGSIPVKGNIGFQAVGVDQSSRGQETFPGNGAGNTIEDGISYTDFLPSLNLSFDLPWDQIVRVGAGRQVARPRMDDLRANNNIGVDRTRAFNPITGAPNTIDPVTGLLVPWWTRDGGNPKLKPWEANAYDVSYEKYFGGNKGYVSLAYFYKDLRTYIYNQATLFDINDTSLTPADYPANPPPNSVGVFNRPANGEGGTIKGYEFAVSVPLDVLWEPLMGFGIQANYSDTKSSVQPLGPSSPSEPMPGLSKYVSNITAYYERFGFSARVSQRHRSAFVGEVQGFGGDRTRRTFEGETVTDVQLGYTFQSGPLENLGILLQVNNLENEPFRSSFNGNNAQPREYFEYGRTYLFGVNYRF